MSSADYFEELNRQPFADEEIPCESCGKPTKGRYKGGYNPEWLLPRMLVSIAGNGLMA